MTILTVCVTFRRYFVTVVALSLNADFFEIFVEYSLSHELSCVANMFCFYLLMPCYAHTKMLSYILLFLSLLDYSPRAQTSNPGTFPTEWFLTFVGKWGEEIFKVSRSTKADVLIIYTQPKVHTLTFSCDGNIFIFCKISWQFLQCVFIFASCYLGIIDIREKHLAMK